MERFARNFAPAVEVLQPENMREKLREELDKSSGSVQINGGAAMQGE